MKYGILILVKELETHSSVLAPGKSHEPRSLVGYSPWGNKELDTTERLNRHMVFNIVNIFYMVNIEK